MQNPVVFLWQPTSKCTLPVCDDLDEEEEEDFQTVSLKDDHWTMEEILDIDIYAFMNTQYHMNCVHTHAHIWITYLHHTITPWI